MQEGPYDRRAFLLSPDCYEPRAQSWHTVYRCALRLHSFPHEIANKNPVTSIKQAFLLLRPGIVLATNSRDNQSITRAQVNFPHAQFNRD
jgi:hypothetical protein